MKAGYKTTEFWVTLLSVLAGGAVMAGILEPKQVEEIQSATVEVVKAIGGLVTILAPVVMYVWSRTRVKQK